MTKRIGMLHNQEQVFKMKVYHIPVTIDKFTSINEISLFYLTVPSLFANYPTNFPLIAKSVFSNKFSKIQKSAETHLIFQIQITKPKNKPPSRGCD